MAPIKTFQTSSKYCPWLSDTTKKMIKKRNAAQKKYSEDKTEENYNEFKSLRNKVGRGLFNY